MPMMNMAMPKRMLLSNSGEMCTDSDRIVSCEKEARVDLDGDTARNGDDGLGRFEVRQQQSIRLYMDGERNLSKGLCFGPA